MPHIWRIARKSVFPVFALVVSVAGGAAFASDAAPIPLHYGVNTFSLAPTKESVMAVFGHRENFNAHDFDVLTIYMKAGARKHDADDWQFVSIFDGGTEALTLSASGGADCLLHDFRILRDDKTGGLQLIVAQREFGASFADTAPVHFKFYALRKNSDGETGRPLYYFELVNTKEAAKPYCDVGEAFKDELGIGAYRR